MLRHKIFRFSYKALVKPVLFLFDPERVHNWFLKVGGLVGWSRVLRAMSRFFFVYEHKSLKQEILGIKFKNPVGLSAGFDKNADLISTLGAVGFGFAQIGTVTDQPYAGNPKPRAIRLPKHKALVVNYGLKSEGAVAVRAKLRKCDIPLSISIGKTNCTATASEKDGITDYVACTKKFAGAGDFHTLNISCPNTFGGEPFTTPSKLDALLSKIKTDRPLMLKMPINLEWREFKKLLDVALEHKVDGVIIGNLNKEKKGLGLAKNVKGAISGLPTQKLSNALIGRTHKYCGDKLVIVGVGGIFNAEDAYEKIKLGASLLQLVTGMIFEGPQLIAEINSGLAKMLKRDGFKNISEAVGTSDQK